MINTETDVKASAKNLIMSFIRNSTPRAHQIDLVADVLVIGGGPAGAWAALTAAASGANTVLVDKGYCGTSGATASANTGVWYATAESEAGRLIVESRMARGCGLAHPDWIARVLDASARQLDHLAESGFPFPLDDEGKSFRANLRGPDYMHFMRRQLKRAGVAILDHSPALELLSAEGVVAGAAGYARQQDMPWRVRAGATVLASGGCAYLSHALGCNVNTGDAYLFGAEVGAELSGMEFSSQYGISPAYSSVTKGLIYFWASFYTDSGELIDCSKDRMVAVAKALLEQPVYAVYDKADARTQAWLRRAQPNIFLPHDRMGIDPFVRRFPITLRAEGTVRGTGGLRLLGPDCATSVPGLYAAGDAATREPIVGAVTGGGSPNAAWAIASGTWAGHGAAAYARSVSGIATRPVQATGGAGLRPQGAVRRLAVGEVIEAVQSEVLPIDKNLFRQGARLNASLKQLDSVWTEVRKHLRAEGSASIRARESAALLATARWAYRSALARTESRGLQRRVDHPDFGPAQQYRLLSGGLDEVWVRPESNAQRLPA